jgi:aryl-alcohol dehydrogenase-like predicted oxidoreductase
MRYQLLGNSGLRVSQLCLGAMTFGNNWGWGASKEESRNIFVRFAEAGGNFIDTANRYTEGNSETFLGEFLASNRQRFVLGTKYSLSVNPDDPNGGGNHRKSMVQALNASLKRLKTDYVDIYWLHAWDFLTPIEEVMRGLDDLVRAGKILYIGISDTPAWIISRANTLAELQGWTSFLAIQVQYNLIERTPERDLIPMANALGLSVTAWSPLAGGLLSGKYIKASSDKPPSESRRLDSVPFTEISKRNLTIAKEVREISNKLGRSPSSVALNWLLQRKIIPIIGSRNISQLIDNLTCIEFEIPKDLLIQLDENTKIDHGFPHEFLKKDNIKQMIFGNHNILSMMPNHSKT